MRPARFALLALVATVAACGALREGPLGLPEPDADAALPMDGGDDGEPSDETDAGVDPDAATPPSADPEWAMWRLPPPSPPAGNYAVANGVARDETTGLEWQQATLAGDRTHADATNACAQAGFRLPTRIELLSLIDYVPGGAGINTAVFGGDSTDKTFWSSTPDSLASTTHAWTVRFGPGPNVTADRGTSHSARCVRGGAAPGEHYAVSTDTMLDRRTGLEWARTTSIAPVTLSDALQTCNDFPGGQWRVPSARELETLFDVRATQAPAWNAAAFGAGTGTPVFWTLTLLPASAAPNTNLVVDFRPNRSVWAKPGSDTAYVRCVRGPK